MTPNKFLFHLVTTTFLLFIGFISPSPLLADWVYFPYEYNQIYKEKYALELELADIRKQHQNELNRLEEEKKTCNPKSAISPKI